MSIIYIVTSGEYSHYRITGVFDSKDKAENFVEIFRETNEIRIEEYELNEHYVKPPKYRAAIGLYNGEVDEIIDPVTYDKAEEGPLIVGGLGTDSRCIYGHGKDMESAIKNAFDFRAFFLEEYKHWDDMKSAEWDWNIKVKENNK